ncbi:hypothetical protein GJU40_05200 [Bacillus lacus]|uniref:Uncharacterized protein n=1 Tax=Metabacillus lacus TaxID=1983721 RepID=A0A7X2LZ49_9BACI|nr:hypothetical protein [Metabacillus lacus]MRX71572.1 hypothetical protein [Metabacillus lacus]
MKKRYLILALVLIIFIASIYALLSRNTETILVDGIEKFEPLKNSNHYLLYYPADKRVSQENTIVKEVTADGKVVREYEIRDQYFRRMSAHQKPNHSNSLYISLFGEATIDNYYYTYDISKKKFQRVKLDYFDYEVGVDHIMHYGDSVLLQTLVSHKTGEQNVNAETNEFNVSISNFSTQNSFETEYGHAPKWAPLLQFNGKIIYGTSGQVDEEDIYVNSGIGVIDLENQKAEYMNINKNADMYPLYSTEEYAYVLGESGEVISYNTDFDYEVQKPFQGMSKDDIFFNEESSQLLLNSITALYQVYSQKKGSIIGLLTYEPALTFQPLQKEYLDPDSSYRFLYQDQENGEIYIISSSEREEKLLVIDNTSFSLKADIPVTNSHLLDFVAKN